VIADDGKNLCYNAFVWYRHDGSAHGRTCSLRFHDGNTAVENPLINQKLALRGIYLVAAPKNADVRLGAVRSRASDCGYAEKNHA
jgi:hypothetical protein